VAAIQTPTVAVAIPEPSGDPAMPAAPGSAASQPESEQPETAAVVVATPKVPTAETEQTPSQSAAAPSLPATETVAQTTPAVEPAAEAPAPQAPEPQAPEPSESLAKETSSDDEPAQNLSEQVLAIVNFEPGSADLNDEGRAQLERVAAAMKSDTSMRVQLQAFAGEDDDSPNASRRLSLSRALVVRGFLLEKDIVSTRMQVRALGDKFGDGPADRVDIRAQGG
jgi:outer membrane protein OmpA-like peptidoglycan-associated protein